MPLSAKEYQRKRRNTQTSTPNSPALSTRTLPAAQPDPNWRRSRSFTHGEQKNVLDRHRQALVADKEDYGASGYHLPMPKLPHPGRIPSSMRSNSTDSTASVSPQYSIPFTSNVSSASSAVTVVDPEPYPGTLSVSLVSKKSQSKSSHHSHHSFMSFPKSLRPFPSRDDERSIWSTETTPPLRGHNSYDAPTSDQVTEDAPAPERKRRKSLTARLIRAFSRKRNPNK
ncbi:hypothetical protein EST38_g10402 [Candolleomyces aberdarensis]|uniref:Uncharacterized protein n=1 Tax=Candolleomyces aberdarensis TaxID=2316362 RepID=A0A4V1Q2L0_9AGAR|nr:hypothetical protein EST38_g10402 [Candolleomyces aberdarensis]